MTQEQIYDETLKYAEENKFKTSDKIKLINTRLDPKLTLEEAILIYNQRKNLIK